jgi:ATPase subunit of ABC transporter with duplicated ATPase domains
MPPTLEFEVEPESNPPTNIHVLIGRNGVGKTHLLRQMSRALMGSDGPSKRFGTFSSGEVDDVSELFANLVSVTFSAFDPFEAMPEKRDATAGVRYSYIGLQRADQGEGRLLPPKSPRALANEFVKSMLACQIGAERDRWRKALETLEADPLFREAEVTALAEGDDRDEWRKHAASVFGKFSSGPKVVLLTITRLVQTVDERTLVLLDEPEAHLHPPLLSAFVRALSDLLIQRNGVAIVATHSPVILQEVPRNCVWKLRRMGAELRAERPDIETFGDNVGVLTREAFGLEVTHSGFHKLLQEAVDNGMMYEEVVGHFNDHLGAEARAIVRALIAARDDG